MIDAHSARASVELADVERLIRAELEAARRPGARPSSCTVTIHRGLTQATQRALRDAHYRVDTDSSGTVRVSW